MANKNISGDVNVKFTEAQSRQSLESGESVKTLFGKLRKWLTDLGTAAFTNSTDYAAASHTQPSSTITAMTGYSKPQATSAITASDTLNQAIGKLEKAVEDAGSSSELEDHIATNVEDDGGVHGIRCYNGKLEVYNDYSQEWCDPSEVGGKLGNVTNLTIDYGNLSLKLRWSDPVNTYGAIWKGTKVVMKAGSYPENITDGQLIYDNQVRDAYSTNDLVINNLVQNVTYYFQLFPYSTTGTITNDINNRVSGTADIVIELGLRADFVNKTFTRLGDAVGLTGGSDFDDFPMYKRRRCNLSDSGVVNAYLGDSGYKIDGTNGQVMVKQPKFYYKVVPVTLNASDNNQLDVAEYWISNKLRSGYKIHPAFKNTNGNEIDFFYESAYEAAADGTKLVSVSNLSPSSKDRATYRSYAANRGSGWRQETIWSLSADQLLMIIEYGRFNMQAAIGYGNVVRYGGSRMGTGRLNSYGNGTYGTTANSTTAVQWRGKENPWGNLNKWIDGINISAGVPYIANSYSFSDDNTNYTQVKYACSSVNNYYARFGYDPDYDWLFMPYGSITGNSTVPIGDAVYVHENGDALYNGGSIGSTTDAGAFYTVIDYKSNVSIMVGRLIYVG